MCCSGHSGAVLCLVAQLYLTLCNPMDSSPPGSSVHGILQAKMLEWVAIPSSRGSSQPRDQTQVSRIAGGFFTSDLPAREGYKWKLGFGHVEMFIRLPSGKVR